MYEDDNPYSVNIYPIRIILGDVQMYPVAIQGHDSWFFYMCKDCYKVYVTGVFGDE